MSRNGQTRVGMGASSIWMIFVVLCLTVFGVLALLTSRADWRLTEKNREAVQAYYRADAKAQRCVQKLDAALYKARTETAVYRQNGTCEGAAEAGLAAGETQEKTYRRLAAYCVRQAVLTWAQPVTVTEKDGEPLRVSWALPIDDRREYRVTVRVCAYEEASRYLVEEARAVMLTGEQDDSLTVWEP